MQSSPRSAKRAWKLIFRKQKVRFILWATWCCFLKLFKNFYMCKPKKLFSSLQTVFGEPFPIFFLFFKKKKDFDSFTHRQPFFFFGRHIYFYRNARVSIYFYQESKIIQPPLSLPPPPRCDDRYRRWRDRSFLNNLNREIQGKAHNRHQYQGWVKNFF